MKRTWTINWVSNVPSSFNGTSHSSASPRHDPARTTLVRSSDSMELVLSAPPVGRARASVVDEPDNATPGKGSSCLPRRRFRYALEKARALGRPARRGANTNRLLNTGVRAPGSDGYHVILVRSLRSTREPRGAA